MTKQERDRQIVERVQAWENRADVAAEFGLNESTVTNICYAGGITGRQERQARNAEILERIQAGESTQEVAEDYGLGQPTVAHICRKAGVAVGRKERQVRNSEIVRRIKEGATPEDVSGDFGLGPAAIIHICRKAGINPREERKKWEERQAWERQVQERRERDLQITERIRAGETMHAVAKTFGLTAERVRQIGLKAGVSAHAVTQERNAKIVERIKAEEAPAAVAKAFGLSLGRVQAICRAAGTSIHAMIRERERNKHRERDEEIVRRVKDGESQASIARQFGLEPHTVQGICWKAGIRPRARLNDKEQLQMRNAEIARRVKAGGTKTATAREFGLKPLYVDFICRQARDKAP